VDFVLNHSFEFQISNQINSASVLNSQAQNRCNARILKHRERFLQSFSATWQPREPTVVPAGAYAPIRWLLLTELYRQAMDCPCVRKRSLSESCGRYRPSAALALALNYVPRWSERGAGPFVLFVLADSLMLHIRLF